MALFILESNYSAVESWHGPRGYTVLPGPINGPHWDGCGRYIHVYQTPYSVKICRFGVLGYKPFRPVTHTCTACGYLFLPTCICYAQSMDLRNPGIILHVQTLDPWFVVQTMEWQRNPGIACAQSINQDNPRIAGAQSIDL